MSDSKSITIEMSTLDQIKPIFEMFKSGYGSHLHLVLLAAGTPPTTRTHTVAGNMYLEINNSMISILFYSQAKSGGGARSS